MEIDIVFGGDRKLNYMKVLASLRISVASGDEKPKIMLKNEFTSKSFQHDTASVGVSSHSIIILFGSV